MARITVEDCLNNVDNRFQLIHLAAKRVRQLKKGAEPKVVCKNKDIVVALREIAAGDVFQAKKGEIYEQMEAPSEIDPVLELDEGEMSRDIGVLPEPDMAAIEEEGLLESETDEFEAEDEVLESEIDELEEALKEK